MAFHEFLGVAMCRTEKELIPQDKYIFNLYNNETHNDEEIKLYMIGFNQGPTIELTNTGIKAQITQGYIRQNTDNIKIMYSIPALQGSSGSPVVNQYGELVAINFAGIKMCIRDSLLPYYKSILFYNLAPNKIKNYGSQNYWNKYIHPDFTSRDKPF